MEKAFVLKRVAVPDLLDVVARLHVLQSLESLCLDLLLQLKFLLLHKEDKALFEVFDRGLLVLLQLVQHVHQLLSLFVQLLFFVLLLVSVVVFHVCVILPWNVPHRQTLVKTCLENAPVAIFLIFFVVFSTKSSFYVLESLSTVCLILVEENREVIHKFSAGEVVFAFVAKQVQIGVDEFLDDCDVRVVEVVGHWDHGG